MNAVSTLKRIPANRLTMGMYIHELCGSWMEHPFWRQSFLLDEPADRDKILASGISEVWIDVSRGKGLDEQDTEVVDREAADAQIERELREVAAPRPPVPVSMEDELERAALLCAKAKKAVISMFSDVRMGNAIRAQDVLPLVSDISASVLRNRGALISLARLKRGDEYTYMHSVAVCALMLSLARELGLPEEDVELAGVAGLLHDVGKVVIPPEVLNKPGKLTDEEFDIVRSHAVEGHRVLLEADEMDAAVLDVCLHHHEKVDGSGYPHRLKGDEISLFAKMGAVCDVYDAITSNRPYKPGWDPAESIRRMLEWSRGHFDDRVFHAFVRCVGIYPIGSLVRLESGRLAVVIEQGASSLLKPRVKAFYSTRSNAYIKPQVLDLAKRASRDWIVDAEDPRKWDFKGLEQMWQ